MRLVAGVWVSVIGWLSADVTVTCISDTARFEFNRIENVYISGITFQGCRNGAAVQMSTVTRATITKSNFTQNNGNSFQASHSVVTFDKSSFYNNSYRYTTSGAVYVSYSNISIKDSRFNDNDGIGINAQYSSVTVDSTEFNYNGFGAISSAYQSSNFQTTIPYSMGTEQSVEGQYPYLSIDPKLIHRVMSK